MTVKHEGNVVGTVMFLVFLLLPVGMDAWNGIRELMSKHANKDTVEYTLVLLVSLGLFGYLTWILFDSSWLNYDDEEKEGEWETNRWIKFSVLFLLPVVKLFKRSTWMTGNPGDNLKWALEVSNQIQAFFMLLAGYISLCADYKSGIGRLFQPFTVPRSRIYTDEKGQRFEVNFIGSVLTIVLILLPTWMGISEAFGRLLLFVMGAEVETTAPVTLSAIEGFIQYSSSARAVADVILLLLYVYVFVLMLASCVKVTFFLKQTKMNYLIFVPVLLIPIAIIFTDHICVYGVTNVHGGAFWVRMLCYFLVNLVAYVSLISPPDSLLAILFQPHVPMINVVEDLPEMSNSTSESKPRVTAVFSE